MANTYFVCSRTKAPIEFDISNERPSADAEIAYFIRGFQIVERMYDFDGYTICFAWGSRTKLPCLGPHVIAVIYGDEHCRIPSYVNLVRAVIKCHGLFPTYVPRLRPLRLAQIELAEFVRNLALWVPTGWRWLASRSVRARCHLVPIGYGIPTDVPPVAFNQRRYIASFLGSMPKKSDLSGLRRMIGTPKFYCRAAMLKILFSLRASRGDDQVKIGLTGDFQESLLDAGKTYSSVMAETKICVAPRGTTHETWRICDGLKFGCVVIADKLPRHPFYRDSPIIQISDWSKLPAEIDRLLANPERLQVLHQASLRFWHDALSEEALALRCADALGLRTLQRRQLSPAA